jgi:hypothetical protein
MKIENDKSFNVKLSGFVASSKNQRQSLQDLIEYGLETYKVHSDTSALSRIVNTLVGVRTIPSKTIKAYICDHANLKLAKVKGSIMFVFKKDGKEVVVKPVATVWWEHEVNATNHKLDVIDPIALMKLLGKRLMDAKTEGKIAQGREEMTDDILGRIREFCNMDVISKDTLKAQAGLGLPA